MELASSNANGARLGAAGNLAFVVIVFYRRNSAALGVAESLQISV